MKTWLTKGFLGVVMGAGVLLGGLSEARAATGYPCSVNLLPATGNTYYGNFGAVEVEMWSGPRCSGSFIRYVSAYSVGATNSAVSTSYLYREAQLMALYRNFMEAASRSIRTYFFTASSSGNGQYVLTYAFFNY